MPRPSLGWRRPDSCSGSSGASTGAGRGGASWPRSSAALGKAPWQVGGMIELVQLVEDFAVAIRRADGCGPQAVGSRTGRAYQVGIGPHTEGQTIRLVADELVTLNGAYAAQTFNVPYPGASRQRCDWCLGSPPLWDWAIEAKTLRLFGDNGKLNDNMLMHVLTPYPAHRSALTDCGKLAASGLAGRKAIVIFGYDYDGWMMDPAIEAFEALASERVVLGDRHEAAYDHLVHPVHRRGRVFAWKVVRASEDRCTIPGHTWPARSNQAVGASPGGSAIDWLGLTCRSARIACKSASSFPFASSIAGLTAWSAAMTSDAVGPSGSQSALSLAHLQF